MNSLYQVYYKKYSKSLEDFKTKETDAEYITKLYRYIAFVKSDDVEQQGLDVVLRNVGLRGSLFHTIAKDEFLSKFITKSNENTASSS